MSSVMRVSPREYPARAPAQFAKIGAGHAYLRKLIEVMSHQLGANTDMYFVLKNLAAKQDITMQDDNPESLSLRFFTANNRDPAPYKFVAPADGKYHLMLASHTGDNHVDPTHVRLVPPAYLVFLFREAGFAEVEIDWRNPPSDIDYAVIATR